MADYSFKNVKVLINGVALEGFAGDDDDVSLDPDGDFNQVNESSDGLAYTTQIVTSMYNLTIKLKEQSSSNTYMSGLFNAGKITGNINLTVAITDFSGNDKALSTKAVIVKPAALVKGRHANQRVWTLRGQFDVALGV